MCLVKNGVSNVVFDVSVLQRAQVLKRKRDTGNERGECRLYLDRTIYLCARPKKLFVVPYLDLVRTVSARVESTFMNSTLERETLTHVSKKIFREGTS